MIDINEVAMKVILHAGDGRMLIEEALEKMAAFNFHEAHESLKLAEKEIVAAHNAQTQVIQSQVAGENMEYSLFFIHAQDTVMTVNSEYRMTEKMLKVFEALEKRKDENNE